MNVVNFEIRLLNVTTGKLADFSLLTKPVFDGKLFNTWCKGFRVERPQPKHPKYWSPGWPVNHRLNPAQVALQDQYFIDLAQWKADYAQGLVDLTLALQGIFADHKFIFIQTYPVLISINPVDEETVLDLLFKYAASRCYLTSNPAKQIRAYAYQIQG